MNEQNQDDHNVLSASDNVWHAMPADEVRGRFASGDTGLTDDEVAKCRERYGSNRLRPPERTGPLKRFLLQFHNVLIYVLLIAAAGTALLEHWVDTGVILGVVLINAVIGFIQEGKAEKALDAIRNMLSPKAVVIRNGERYTIAAEELVPGDLVLVEAGDKVPADLRLFTARNLRVEEAILTGESVAVDKHPDPVAADCELGDRACMAFSGTLVAFGQGRGVVVATGDATEIGRVSTMLSEVETLTTPLLRQIAQFGRWLSVAIVGLAAATFAIGLWMRDYAAVDMFLAAVSLAVAAIPEGLPAIMTITLAIGVQRMARRNSIIRRLPAVETLGAVTVICSDKTGTLTRNEMTVRSIVTSDADYSMTGVGYAPQGEVYLGDEELVVDEGSLVHELLRNGALCNDARAYNLNGTALRDWVDGTEGSVWVCEGDPTEGALMVAAMKGSLDPDALEHQFPRRDVIPFESANKYMATLHDDGNGRRFIVMKGAPERVMESCGRQCVRGGEAPLDRARWERALDELAARGQRVLAVAIKSVPADKDTVDTPDVDGGLAMLGMFGIIDPPREEAIQAVAECHRAGISVKMITGDHALTACVIGRQLGIGDGHTALTGREIETLSDEELAGRVEETDVFARAAPEHKLRLVKAMQARGHVVAMTGDGVNDAPALKRADIGVAMGIKGTEASKEASEMVLADDNFVSIAHAVEEGRTVYDNLTKAILFILPTNGGQAFTIVAAVLLGMVLPLTPVQVLWVNMVVAVTLALALAFEPAEPGIMKRAPRPPRAPLLTGLLIWRVFFVSALLVGGTFGHFLWLELAGASHELARTAAINTLVVGTLFYLFNSRYILEPVLNYEGLFGSRAVWIAIGVLVVLQAAFTYAPPLQMLFGTVGLGLDAWLLILAFGIAVMLVVELEKALLRRFTSGPPHAPARDPDQADEDEGAAAETPARSR